MRIVSTAEALSIAAVAISAISVGAAFFGFRNERRLADRSDARSTLAEGALALGHMRIALGDASQSMGGALRGEAMWPDDFDGEIAKLREAGFALEAALAAVQIRFEAKHDAPKALSAALYAAREQMRVYTFARYQPFAATQGPRDPEADRQEGARWFETFMTDKDAYLVAAQKAAGAKL
jgi:hypothetical protein